MKKSPEYTQEFRDSVVKMVVEEKQKTTEVAERLGVSAATIYYWVKQHNAKHGKNTKESQTTEANLKKIKELEKQLERVTTERDILKKAAAYFAKFPD